MKERVCISCSGRTADETAYSRIGHKNRLLCPIFTGSCPLKAVTAGRRDGKDNRISNADAKTSGSEDGKIGNTIQKNGCFYKNSSLLHTVGKFCSIIETIALYKMGRHGLEYHLKRCL